MFAEMPCQIAGAGERLGAVGVEAGETGFGVCWVRRREGDGWGDGGEVGMESGSMVVGFRAWGWSSGVRCRSGEAASGRDDGVVDKTFIPMKCAVVRVGGTGGPVIAQSQVPSTAEPMLGALR